MANAELNQELLEKVKAAKSPNELLALARENGIANFTGACAQACFRQKAETGELSDEELEHAVGGSGGGRKIITPCIPVRSGPTAIRGRRCAAPAVIPSSYSTTTSATWDESIARA